MFDKQFISITGNNETTIKDNLFINNKEGPIIIVRHGDSYFPKGIDWTYREAGYFKDLEEETRHIHSPFQRQLLLDELLLKFMRQASLNNISPLVRTYAYFSAFSTIRQWSETSDVARLELEEKDHLVTMAKRGFRIKTILSLQLDLVFSLGYTYEQCYERCTDLVNTLKELERHNNISLVVDSNNSLNSTWILDTVTVMKADPYDVDVEEQTFNATLISSKKEILQHLITEFDSKHEQLRQENEIIKRQFKINSTTELVRLICTKRLEHLKSLNT